MYQEIAGAKVQRIFDICKIFRKVFITLPQKTYKAMKWTSKTKFCKGTDIPKHSGNFSYSTVHYGSLQQKTYPVYNQGGILIVGQNTPLSNLMPQAVIELALHDPYFGTYIQDGVRTISTKKYEAYKKLHKNYSFCADKFSWRNYLFTYTEAIYTDGDFDYKFPEY